MTGDQALDLLFPEVASRPARRVAKDVLDPPAKLLAEPFRDRDPEAVFGAMHEVVGQATLSRELLEQPLRVSSTELGVSRQPGGELVNPMIEKRRPHLERV